MTADINLEPWIDATSGLMAAVCSHHPEGERIFEDSRSGRTSIRLLFDHRKRHLVLATADERGVRPVASFDLATATVEYSAYSEHALTAGPVH